VGTEEVVVKGEEVRSVPVWVLAAVGVVWQQSIESIRLEDVRRVKELLG